VSKYNAIRLHDLLRPVVVINSGDTGLGMYKVTPEQCDTIQNLTLCIGTKVMLTQNIWVELGLVNGIEIFTQFRYCLFLLFLTMAYY
jgi:hypothetical protein